MGSHQLEKIKKTAGIFSVPWSGRKKYPDGAKHRAISK
jgi:hypothetical protein